MSAMGYVVVLGLATIALLAAITVGLDRWANRKPLFGRAQHLQGKRDQSTAPPDAIAEVGTTQAARVDRSSEVAAFFRAGRHSPFDPLARLRDGDIDGARLAMQKIAYMVHADKKSNPRLVVQFTELMGKFARIDPLFWHCLQIIKPVVASTPGIRQTALYPYLQVDVETARYVLYFAETTGHLVRRKRGNSYEVFLPDQELPALPVKPRRKRT